MKVGGKNTDFFHRMANSHFRKNTIARIKINGVWISDELKLRKGIADTWKAWLSDDMAWRAEIDGLPFTTLSPEEASCHAPISG